MPFTTINPNDRTAIVGKTGSGKTMLGVVLAGRLARALPPPWEVWWLDTKNVDDDIRLLREWGFRNAASEDDQQTSNIRNAKYFYIVEGEDERYDPATVAQVQEVCRQAYIRQRVIVVIDEYTQAVPSQRNPGKHLQNIFARGRGRRIGLIGMTQEPVYVPRQLISQATHTVMMNVSYAYDVKYLQSIDKLYKKPVDAGHPHGFYWRWNDGGGEMDFYPNQKLWDDQLRLALQRPLDPAAV
jgi:hypothetical protein